MTGGRFFLSVASTILVLGNGCGEGTERLSLRETELTIRQVDYEGAIFFKPPDPYPHLDFSKVRTDVIVAKKHRAIIMENRFIRLTLLPDMGRVYSLVNRTTNHEVFWQNDVVTVGSASNPAGWWIWIGGMEFTLPGDEHGTTWAERWRHRIVENSATKKTVRLDVTERATGLREELDFSLVPDGSSVETAVRIVNPTAVTVPYAHWVSPQWAPGGRNELTDNTELIIPTRRILIPEGYRNNLGESPQEWWTSRLRFIKGWTSGWGDLMAEKLDAGFYAAYSHDEEEGVVRVFDPEINPGVDVWTYGYHPRGAAAIPMGSGATSNGYVEMWGGTSRIFPDERRPLMPGTAIGWTEWMYPFQGTGGLTHATRDVAFHLVRDEKKGKVTLALTSSLILPNARCRLSSSGSVLMEKRCDLAPDHTLRWTVDDPRPAQPLKVEVWHSGEKLAECTDSAFN